MFKDAILFQQPSVIMEFFGPLFGFFMHSENINQSSHPVGYNFKEDSTVSVSDILLINIPHST